MKAGLQLIDYFCTDMASRDPRDIRIERYAYELPQERIAIHPLADRDGSRLLVDDGQRIRASMFRELPALLPRDSLLVMNDTRVFHARLVFRKESGARIEVFCLEPDGVDFQQAFSSHGPVTWKVLIGNARRWKSGPLTARISIGGLRLRITAHRLDDPSSQRVTFSWDSDRVSFGQVVDAFGTIPIPPYLHRESEQEDYTRYQTAYAREMGSVAAPTAGLHFTPELLDRIGRGGHQVAFLTLHVGAGTFKPVIEESIGAHEMHPEHFEVHIDVLRQLRDKPAYQPCIAVGTTSVRTLESLYWAGLDHKGEKKVEVAQWRPYGEDAGVTVQEALGRLVRSMERNGTEQMEGITRLMITPGYRFRVVDGMLTNFHQPRSTLLLLVSALAGERWQEVYDFALRNGFRFLSYGDSCLFLPR